MEPSLNISNLFKEIEPQTPTTSHNMIVGDSTDYYYSKEPLGGLIRSVLAQQQP
jgi:hypothetical protein